jgi:hypothetical protein
MRERSHSVWEEADFERDLLVWLFLKTSFSESRCPMLVRRALRFIPTDPYHLVAQFVGNQLAEKHRDVREHLNKDFERGIASAAGTLTLDGRMYSIRRKTEVRWKVIINDSDYIDYAKRKISIRSGRPLIPFGSRSP